jgi:hypothetical protein
MNPRRLQLLPKCAKSKTLHELPNRAKLLIDMELPKCTKFSVETLSPIRVAPATLQHDASRAKDRKDKLLAK